ncbi:chemerin-like receptor 1 [Alligator mississippiensis]|uniref:chemerin-like receptor 1 n=1 Tax=Alligator mississippiensis TaxID=8496 RepID=UPI002877E5FC|nr:chemerin-like receptor 1 [Alligator mississippiensis]XP_059574151.1 chemerin-like receptor 1 [Alligator mississippiensis]XP_059574152.1 chemerin-like receptor 1 [Alligator mississippiensis]
METSSPTSSPGTGNHDKLTRGIHIFSMIIYSIAFLLGVTGNGLVIWVTGFHMKRTVNTVWFLNLAIADFIFTFFLPLNITSIAMNFHWPFGRALCKLNGGLASLNLYASVFFLTVISLDRCVCVVSPVWTQNHRQPRLASLVALGIWILSLILCIPYWYFREIDHDDSKNVTYCYKEFDTTGEEATEEEWKWVSTSNSRATVISRFIFSFIIPFYIIVICYGVIVVKLLTSQLALSSKPFKIIAVVIVVFFLCWFPLHVFSFLEMDDLPKFRTAVHIGMPLVSSLAFVNSCLNPILYVFMAHDFKEKLRHSLFLAFEKAFTEDAPIVAVQTQSTMKSDSQAL